MTAFSDVFYSLLCSKIQSLPQTPPPVGRGTPPPIPPPSSALRPPSYELALTPLPTVTNAKHTPTYRQF